MHTTHILPLPIELFLTIMDYFEPFAKSSLRQEEEAQDERRALYALARTCRGLTDHALDRLWCGLNSLKPLIQCYGGAVDDDTPETPLSSAEWNIIRKYRPRVKKLRLTGTASAGVSFLRRIGEQSSLVLPELSILCLDSSQITRCTSTASCPSGLLGPNILCQSIGLSLGVGVTVEGLQEFVGNISRCPNLNLLAISPGNPAPEENQILSTLCSAVSSALSDAIPRCENIRYLLIRSPIKLSHSALESLSKSSKLELLDAAVPHDQEKLIRASLVPTDTPFRYVHHLELEVPNLEFVTNLLRCSPSEQPRDRGHQELESICIRVQAGSGSTSRSVHALYPLACFDRLERLAIDPGDISIDDDQLLELAGSWPSLQGLEMTWHREVSVNTWLSAKHPTLRGMSTVFKSRQNLIELLLSIDAKELPKLTDVDVSDIRIDEWEVSKHFAFVNVSASRPSEVLDGNKTSAGDKSS